MTHDDRSAGLLAWQLKLYPDGHRDRRNLLVHALTVPLFLTGTLTLLGGALVAPWTPLAGLAAMATALVAQGRGHKREATAPVPFRGPGDVLARLFVEQWVTFPRFVLGGGFARAWRAAGSAPQTA